MRLSILEQLKKYLKVLISSADYVVTQLNRFLLWYNQFYCWAIVTIQVRVKVIIWNLQLSLNKKWCFPINSTNRIYAIRDFRVRVIQDVLLYKICFIYGLETPSICFKTQVDTHWSDVKRLLLIIKTRFRLNQIYQDICFML